jgi:hypothetical protein
MAASMTSWSTGELRGSCCVQPCSWCRAVLWALLPLIVTRRLALGSAGYGVLLGAQQEARTARQARITAGNACLTQVEDRSHSVSPVCRLTGWRAAAVSRSEAQRL